LNDSKKLKESDRDTLRNIIEKEALAWSVASVDNNKIDEINILNASFLAMHLAIDKLKTTPELLLIDGNRFKPYKKIPHQCVIKGDGKYMSIAAASILAKTHRDEFMKKAHTDYPEYNWKQNKGYPTQAHKKAVSTYGITALHRKTFNMSEQLKFEF
jgi:ribonuclease HII